jgi:hypothetical protein
LKVLRPQKIGATGIGAIAKCYIGAMTTLHLLVDRLTQQYAYLWSTQRSWMGGCWELVFRLNDGQERLVRFRPAR